MTGILGTALLLVVVAIALRLLLSSTIKPVLRISRVVFFIIHLLVDAAQIFRRKILER